MKNLHSKALKVEDNVLFLLDQTQLPHKELWMACESLEDIVLAIKSLKVRGAPLIGLAAVCFLQGKKDQGFSEDVLVNYADELLESRPTAVNLQNALSRFKKGTRAEEIFEEDFNLCQSMAEHGAALIREGENILTHCNTGALATAGAGTAFGVLSVAHRQKKKIHVFVDETRPLLQGGRLTTWECLEEGIPHTLICDNMAASLMKYSRVDRIFVGADRVALNGDVANKIGTYSLAVNAFFHKIPFYVVAPSTTFDVQTKTGVEIEIERRADSEVKGVDFHFGETLQWAPARSKVHNPAFDVTPHELVTAYISEKGVYQTAQEAFSFV